MERDYQTALKGDIYGAWGNGAINVMPTLATGGGKTFVFCRVIVEKDVPTVVVAHRQELLGQSCLALNREDVPHGITAPKKTIQQIIALEMKEHGYSRYNARAPVRVAGVDTLIKRDATDRWFNQVKLVVIDEGHHVLRLNKWGRARGMFPDALGLFPTAHAFRADGAGLGRSVESADGLVDALVVGPCGRDLINRGFLTDYRLVCPPSHLNLQNVNIGSTGDFNYAQLRAAVHADGAIVGDVVDSYMRFAAGKLGVTFAVDIEAAVDLAKAYRARGIPAEIITGDTETTVRSRLMQKFRDREILQLVSVDVLGEGVDVPAIEVVSMARPTASFQLYAQQFGRALRPMISKTLQTPGPNGGHFEVWKQWDTFTDEERKAFIAYSQKPKAIVIDHVGNWKQFHEDHGMVDTAQVYSLNRREKSRRAKERDPDYIPERSCIGTPEKRGCFFTYPVVYPKCPHCGVPFTPTGRAKPEQVDGDLFELSPDALALLRGEVAAVDAPPNLGRNPDDMVGRSIAKNHRDRQDAQAQLRTTMALWAGWQSTLGRDEPEKYRRFFHRYGTDVMTAQTLKPVEANNLYNRILADLSQHNIVSA